MDQELHCQCWQHLCLAYMEANSKVHDLYVNDVNDVNDVTT